MMLLDDLIGSGAITFIVLAVLAAEALICIFYLKRLRKMLPSLAAGASLVLALWAALAHRSSLELAFFLGVGFIFHVLEVWQWLSMSKNQPT